MIVSLRCAVLVMGMTFVIAQVVALREFLVVVQGNELYIGIILGNWLLLEAIGSAVLGRIADRSVRPMDLLASLQELIALLLPATLVAIRMNRDLVAVPHWQMVGPVRVWIGSFTALAPLALCLGLQFTVCCRLFTLSCDTYERPAGIVYYLEACGSVGGGVLFTYLLAGRVDSVHTMLLLVVLNAACALLVRGLYRQSAKDRASVGTSNLVECTRYPRIMFLSHVVVCVALLVGAIGLWASPWAAGIEHATARLRLKDLVLTKSADSVYGNVSVYKTGDQVSFFHNGIPALTSPVPDVATAEEFAHLSLLSHPLPKTALCVGGGLGGPLTELLKHPIHDLYYTEIDPLVIRMVEEFSTPLTLRELGDPRVHIHFEDARKFLLTTNLAFDVVLISNVNPSSLLLNRMCTEEFFAMVQRHLRPGGLLCVSVTGSSSYLGQELLLLNKGLISTLRHVFPHVRTIPGESNLIIASRDISVAELTPALLADRLLERRLQAAMVSPEYISFKLDPRKRDWIERSLDEVGSVKRNRDLWPSLVFYKLSHHLVQLHPTSRALFELLERVTWRHVFVALLVLNVPFVVLLLSGRMHRVRALSLSIFTTGCAGMTVETLLIFCFQCLYGYVYQWVGILVASFMAGLAMGAYLSTRSNAHKTTSGYRAFVVVEVVLCAILISMVGLFSSAIVPIRWLDALVSSGIMQSVFVASAVLTGMAVGAEFPLAYKACLFHGSGPSRLAGTLYGLDLAGACLGAVMVGPLLVPLIGSAATLLLTAVMKAVGLLYLIAARS